MLITNDQGYWITSSRATVDTAFCLHHGRILAGALSWSRAAGTGTTTGRDTVLELTGRYPLAWTDFSTVTQAPGGLFRSLAVPIGASQSLAEDQRRRAPLSATTDKDLRRLQAMVGELRTMCAECEPKSNLNPRYLRYSNAVSTLNWIADDLRREEAGR